MTPKRKYLQELRHTFRQALQKQTPRFLAVCSLITCLHFFAHSCQSALVSLPAPHITLADDASPFLDLSGQWKVRFFEESLVSSDSLLNLGSTEIPVPSNWYAAGIDMAGMVQYERNFFLPSISADTLLYLVFEGVDYETTVFLNGRFLGRHTGYFQPFAFPARDFLRLGGENILTVRVNSPIELPMDWSLTKRAIKGIFGHHDTRPGGAWKPEGQDANTGGIWGKVYLAASKKVIVERVGITPNLNEKLDEARICLQTVLWSASTTYIQIQHQISLPDSAVQKISRPKRLIRYGQNVFYDTLLVKKPRLWHTFDVGKPHIYTLETAIFSTDSTLSDKDNLSEKDKFSEKNKLSSRKDKFGIRTVRYDTASGEWYLNNKRLFLRGTNYIGTQYLSTMQRKAYDRDADLMRTANINAVRVHAHIARKEFYDACDSLGLLVWQDFPLQWGYADDGDVVESASAQVWDMISLLGNHPSIAAWCLHNEPPFDADWMQYKYPNYRPLQNQHLNVILTRIARHADSLRYVHPFSATREHRWEGWYFGQWTDYAKPTKERLITEFGAQGLPELATLQTIVGRSPLLPNDEETWTKWEYHNFQRNETFGIAKVPTGATIPEFIHNSQQHQANVIDLAAESYRMQRYAPVGAVFQFMFVEAWASMNWAIMDYLRKPKPAYFRLQEAYQPTFIAASLDSASKQLHISVINDRWTAFPQARLQVQIKNETATLHSLTKTLDVSADALTKVDSLRLPESGTYRLEAMLFSSTGDTLSHRTKLIHQR